MAPSPARWRGCASSDKIGAVGGKIIRANGQLQEAGSIIWDDGTTTGYLRDASPLAPEANYVRDVDYCSAVFLLCRDGAGAQSLAASTKRSARLIMRTRICVSASPRLAAASSMTRRLSSTIWSSAVPPIPRPRWR